MRTQKAIRLFNGAANVLHRVELELNFLQRKRKIRILRESIGEVVWFALRHALFRREGVLADDLV